MSYRTTRVSLFLVFLFFAFLSPGSYTLAQANDQDPTIPVTEPGVMNSQGGGEVFRKMTEKKIHFIQKLLPQIEEAKGEIDEETVSLIPNSIVIVQSVLESGWGTSTNAKRHKNYFGLRRGDGKYMRFASSKDGLKRYLMTLATHPSYRRFQAGLGKKNPLELVGYLGKYSENPDYINELRRIIRKNDLMKLDG